MAGKKAPATASTTPATAAPTPKPPRAKAAPKPKAVKAAPPPEIDGEPKKRNMSAVSNDFVSTVHASLSDDLKAKLKVKEVKELCEAFIKNLVDGVKTGKPVNFTNNMSFARKKRAARVYQNLKTQEKIEKPAHYVFTMTVKPNLKKQFDAIEVVDAAPPAAAKA